MSDAGSLVMLIGGQEYTAQHYILDLRAHKGHICFCISCFSLIGHTRSEINEAVDHFPEWRLLNMSEINQE